MCLAAASRRRPGRVDGVAASLRVSTLDWHKLVDWDLSDPHMPRTLTGSFMMTQTFLFSVRFKPSTGLSEKEALTFCSRV